MNERERTPYIAILPATLMVTVLGLVPIVYMFVLSMTNMDLTNPLVRFTGLSNYLKLFTHERYLHAVYFTFGFAFAAVSVELIYGFLIAYLLSSKHVSQRYSAVMRTLMLIPYVATPVAVAYVFKTLIYDPNFGYLAYFLGLVGLSPFQVARGTWSAPIAVFVMEVILRTPFMTVILYAGISSINPSILEVAQIDGASWFKRMRHIVVPLISPVIAIGFAFRFMDAVKMFDEIFVVTDGGPGYITENLSLFVVREGFNYSRMGVAATAAFIFLFLNVLIVSRILKIAKI